MSDYVAAQDTITPFMALLWILYPVGALVFLELLLRANQWR